MFGTSYFGGSYFGPSYWGPGVDIDVTRPQPPWWRSPDELYDQALQEDEELIMICRAFIEIISCR